MVNIPTWGKKFRANPEGTPGLPPWGHNIDRCIMHLSMLSPSGGGGVGHMWGHLVQIALTRDQNANQNPQGGDAIDDQIPHICPNMN